VVAPPLPDVEGLQSSDGSGSVVVRPLAHDVGVCRAEEHDEGQLRWVDIMDLKEDLLPQSWVHYRQFLLVEAIQGRFVGVIAIVVLKLGDVKSVLCWLLSISVLKRALMLALPVLFLYHLLIS